MRALEMRIKRLEEVAYDDEPCYIGVEFVENSEGMDDEDFVD